MKNTLPSSPAALLCALLLAGCGGAEAPRPNVILVTLDTTRADHFGCYGYGRNTTPAFDRLSREGARFDFCISTAGVTPVSHASILTGLNQYNHGLRVLFAASGFTLNAGVPTMATLLREEGYATGAFMSAFPVSEVYAMDRDFEVFDNGLGRPASGVMTRAPTGDTAYWDTGVHQRASNETTDAVLAWLNETEQPFFTWIHYWDPHDPILHPPSEILTRFSPGMTEIKAPSIEVYDAEIYYVDAQFQRILEKLENDGRLENTLIVITADHGEGYGEHDWHAHRLLYQEQIHLPLILRGPGVRPRTVVPDLVRATDILPTVLELVGVDGPADMDGRTLVPLMNGEEEAPRLAYAEQLNKWDTNAKMLAKRPQDDLLHVLMDRRWKLIYRPLNPDASELYDLDADADEAINLYTPEHPEGRRLREDLVARDVFRLESFGAADETSAAAAALKGLGYIDDGGEAGEED